MARTYKRDSRGRFAGGGGGSSGGRGGRPATKRVQRGTNRLTRDNSGKITGQGGSGATARGGRLKTASGNQRATQLDRLKGRIAGTVGKGGKVKGGARMKSAGLNKDGMAVFKSTDKPAKTYRIPQQNRAKPARKLEFNQSDFQRRSQRTAGIRNPQVRQKAQSLYGKILDLDSTPRQLRSMFKKAGKPKSGGRTAAQRRSQREHRDMLALANRLFR